MRSQEEIKDRFRALGVKSSRGGFVGMMDAFGQEVLAEAMDFSTATDLSILKPEVTEEEWVEIACCSNEEKFHAKARKYLDFAIGKASDHRGISANRSVAKMREYLWALELDVDAFEAAPYPQYGAPQLRVAAKELGYEFPPEDDAYIARMAEGLPCRDGCNEGCGSVIA